MRFSQFCQWTLPTALVGSCLSMAYAAPAKTAPIVHTHFEIEEALITRGERLFDQSQELILLRTSIKGAIAESEFEVATRKSFEKFDEQAELIKQTCELLRVKDGGCEEKFESGKPLATLAELSEILNQIMATCRRIAIMDRKHAAELEVGILAVAHAADKYAEWADQWDGKLGDLQIKFLSAEINEQGKGGTLSASVMDDPGALVRRLQAWGSDEEDLTASENVDEDESVEPRSDALADVFPIRIERAKKPLPSIAEETE